MKDNGILKELENIKGKNLLIFIDSDETLKRSDGTISKRTKKAILENKKIGNKIIISTARPRYQTLDVKKEVKADDIIISSNGAEIYDSKNKEVISSFFIDSTEVIKLVDYAYQMNVRLILTIEDFEYVTKDIRNKKQITSK